MNERSFGSIETIKVEKLFESLPISIAKKYNTSPFSLLSLS